MQTLDEALAPYVTACTESEVQTRSAVARDALDRNDAVVEEVVNNAKAEMLVRFYLEQMADCTSQDELLEWGMNLAAHFLVVGIAMEKQDDPLAPSHIKPRRYPYLRVLSKIKSWM